MNQQDSVSIPTDDHPFAESGSNVSSLVTVSVFQRGRSKYRGGHRFVSSRFPANLEVISLAFSLLSVMLPLALDHPLQPVYSGFEDI
jgi:hypothetical protein